MTAGKGLMGSSDLCWSFHLLPDWSSRAWAENRLCSRPRSTEHGRSSFPHFFCEEQRFSVNAWQQVEPLQHKHLWVMERLSDRNLILGLLYMEWKPEEASLAATLNQNWAVWLPINHNSLYHDNMSSPHSSITSRVLLLTGSFPPSFAFALVRSSSFTSGRCFGSSSWPAWKTEESFPHQFAAKLHGSKNPPYLRHDEDPLLTDVRLSLPAVPVFLHM